MAQLPCRSTFLALLVASSPVLGAGCFRDTRSEPDDPFLSVSNPEQAVRVYRDRTLTKPDNAQAWSDLGNAYLEFGNTALAIEALRKSSQLDPGPASTWALLGLAYRKQKMVDEAAVAYGQALDRSPQSSEYLAAYRELMESRGRHREVVAKVAERVAIGPGGTKMLNGICREYLRGGLLSAAEDAAAASLVLDPNQPDTLLILARALEMQERYRESAEVYGSVLDLDATRTEAMVGLGRSYLGSHATKEAEAAFQKALHRDSRNVDALQGLIEVYLQMEELSQASSLLREALRLAPDATALQVAQAELYLKQGHAGQALSVLKLAVVHAPDDLRLNRALGKAYLRAGQPERAIEPFDRALAQAPGDSWIIRNRCQALKEAGRSGQVATQCKDVESPEGMITERSVSPGSSGKGRTYSKAPTNRRQNRLRATNSQVKAGNPSQVAASLPSALRPTNIPTARGDADKEGARGAFLAGQTQFKAGDYQNAAESFRKACELDPLNPNYYYNLGVTYAARNEYDNASEAFREALTLNPNDLDALYNLGTTFFRLGNYPDAIVTYQQVLKARKDDREAYRSMGAAYEALGQLSKAQECYQLGGGQPAMEDQD